MRYKIKEVKGLSPTIRFEVSRASEKGEYFPSRLDRRK
jgi:hypothetical protein